MRQSKSRSFHGSHTENVVAAAAHEPPTNVRFCGRYWGKADMAIALQMSAYDPKRTF